MAITTLKTNIVRLNVDGDNVTHLERLEGGAWRDLTTWGSASSSSSSSSFSSSSSSSSSAGA